MSVSNILAPINHCWSCRKANKKPASAFNWRGAVSHLLKELCEVRLRLSAAPRTWMQQEAQCARLWIPAAPPAAAPRSFPVSPRSLWKCVAWPLWRQLCVRAGKVKSAEAAAEIYRGVLQPQTEMLLDCQLNPASTLWGKMKRLFFFPDVGADAWFCTQAITHLVGHVEPCWYFQTPQARAKNMERRLVCYSCAQVPVVEVVCAAKVQLGSFRGAGRAAQAGGLEVAVCGEGLVIKKMFPDNNRLINMCYQASLWSAFLSWMFIASLS